MLELGERAANELTVFDDPGALGNSQRKAASGA